MTHLFMQAHSYYVSGSFLGVENVRVNKTDRSWYPWSLNSNMEYQKNK